MNADAALIAAGTLAGEGRLNIGVVLATAMVAWMLGSLAGYEIGIRKGRWLLEHPGRLGKMRLKLLAKGDRAFAHNNFVAAVTMPAFVSGIFRVRFYVFVLGALVAGIGFIGMYAGLSYFLGAEIAKRVGDAGTKVVLGVLVIVAIGLGIKAGVSKWHPMSRSRTSTGGEDALPRSWCFLLYAGAARGPGEGERLAAQPCPVHGRPRLGDAWPVARDPHPQRQGADRAVHRRGHQH